MEKLATQAQHPVKIDAVTRKIQNVCAISRDRDRFAFTCFFQTDALRFEFFRYELSNKGKNLRIFEPRINSNRNQKVKRKHSFATKVIFFIR